MSAAAWPRIVGYAAVWAFAVNFLWIPQSDPNYALRVFGPAWYLWLCGFGFGALHVLLSHRFRLSHTLLAAGMAALQAEIALAMHGNTTSGWWLALPFAAAAMLAGCFSRPLPRFLHRLALSTAAILIVIGGSIALGSAVNRSETIIHSPDGAYSAFVGHVTVSYADFLYIQPRYAPVGWFTSRMNVDGYKQYEPTAQWSDTRAVVVSGKVARGTASEPYRSQDVTVLFK